ncbi:MAG: hypothetical protein VXX63_07875 [Bacteroidota bacterium]|nr:hypothetical protein [Bacteroidota bacterium]
MTNKFLMTVATIGLLFVANCTRAQKDKDGFLTAEQIIGLIDREDLKDFKLESVELILQEDFPIEKRTKAGIFYTYAKTNGDNEFRRILLLLDIGEDKTVAKVGTGVTNECIGVNCKRCIMEMNHLLKIRCECDEIGDPTAGASYCNHKITASLGLEMKEVKLSLTNPSIIIEANNLLKH